MELKVALDTVWVLMTAMLVFFMNLGFAMVEVGFARLKNCVNILSKNFIIFAVSSLGFLLLGWGLMFGDGNMFFGMKGLFFAGGLDNSPATGVAYKGVYSAIAWTGVPLWSKFFFQLVFCGTAATIVSGVATYTFIISLIFWSLLKVTIGIRVNLHEEVEGLDIGEHGNSAYPEFLSRKPAYSFLGLKDEK